MERILELLSDADTAQLYERQEEELRAVVSQRKREKRGVFISELPVVEKIIVLCSERLEQEGLFEQSLVEMLSLCELPFQQESSNEKYRNSEQICSLLYTLTYLLLSNSNMLKIATARALFEFVKNRKLLQDDERGERDPREERDAALLDQRPDEWAYHQHLFKKSGAMQLVAQAVRKEVDHLFGNDVDGDGRISAAEYDRAYGILPGGDNPHPQVCTVSLMKLVCELAAYRENALSLNRDQVPALLVKVVSQLVDFRKEEIKLMVQILWSVLEHSLERIKCSQVSSNRMQLIDKYRNANALFGLGNTQTVGMLRSLAERMLVEGFKRSDKELRNEVLIISSLLSKRKGNLKYFQETGYLSLLLLYASAVENELPTGCEQRHFATSDPLDQEMKVLIWYLIEEVSRLEENKKSVADSLLLQSLLFYIDPATKQHPARMQWSPQQLRSLQLHALSLLAVMVGRFPSEFSTCGGPRVVVQYLVEQDTLQLEMEDLEVDTQAVDAALQVVLQMCETYPSVCVPQADGPGLVKALLDFMAIEDTRIRSTSSHIMTYLLSCEESAFIKQFKQSHGIHTLCSNLNADRTDFLFSDSVLVSTLSCIQSALSASPKLLREFLFQDGIEQLLSLLESCAPSQQLQGQVLATLSDIVSLAPKDVQPFVLQWRSPRTGETVIQLVLDLWVNHALPKTPRGGVCKNNNNNNHEVESNPLVIEDVNTPLCHKSTTAETNGTEKPEDTGNPKKVAKLYEALRAAQNVMIPNDEQSVLEGADQIDFRDRLYSFLSTVTQDDLEDQPEVWSTLTRDQKTVWQLAKHYPSFLRGEQWVAVQAKLEEMQLKPVYYDQAIIDTEREASIRVASEAREKQLEEQQHKEEDERKGEEAFFDKIIEKRDQEVQAKMVKKQVSVMKRRFEQKERQKQFLSTRRTTSES